MDDVVRRVLEADHGLKIGRRLGRGGVAEVYQAEPDQGVPCAVKVSLDPLEEGHPAVQMELDNVRLVQNIGGHPRLVTLLDYWLIGGYLVTRWELSTEGSLADELARHTAAGRPGIPREVLGQYLLEAAEGLEFLNNRGIYHRDIKPQNLLLFHGQVKLADLGLAKFAGLSTATHTGCGTPGYLPLEAYEEHRLHPTVDLYSLAATYLKLRTGREPFGTSWPEILERQKEGNVVIDGLEPDEAEWVRQALAYRPEDRPQQGVMHWVRSHPLAARPPAALCRIGAELIRATEDAPPKRLPAFAGQPTVLPSADQNPTVATYALRETTRVPPRPLRVQAGVDTLAYAVAAATKGATLVLEPGEFFLSRPLEVTKSLTIKAEQPGQSCLKLKYSFGDQMMHFTGDASWVVRGLRCEFLGKRGDVLLVDEGNIQIDRCEFTGGRGDEMFPAAGIRITGTADATITDCNVQGNDIGILFEEHSEGLALRNICRNNNGHGICVTGRAWPTLEENQCVENALCGIVYHDDSSGLARRNICRHNKHGIWVGHQARPTLEENKCVKNRMIGVVYVGHSSGLARRNICQKNRQIGIYVGEYARPTLEENRCVENQMVGIAHFGFSFSQTRENICRKNRYYGIYVDDYAQPTLEENRCVENRRSGMAYFGHSSGRAERNICRGNNYHGIYVDQQANPTVERNKCLNNKLFGIFYEGESSGVAKWNVCKKNKFDGIYVSEQAWPLTRCNDFDAPWWLSNDRVIRDQLKGANRENRSKNNSVTLGGKVVGGVVGGMCGALMGAAAGPLGLVIGIVLGAMAGAGGNNDSG
uniref:Protein kinase domain-containing protein n=1 Tax=Schlesneria paludicola TaxID=360056 RepID=A0A7C4QTH1_9PLAN